MVKKTLTIAILSVLSFISCKEYQKNENSETAKKTTVIDNNRMITRQASDDKQINPFEGVYLSSSKENGYFWTEVKIENIINSDSCRILVSSEKVRGKVCCSFNKSGVVRNDTLFIETTDLNRPITVFITKNKSKITIDAIEKKDGDRYILNYYCCGGGSLIGDYEAHR
jgi:hypothetical protein